MEECGPVIHSKYPFLGACPDGIIGSNTAVEIKCSTILEDKSEQEAEEIVSSGWIKWLDSDANFKNKSQL